MRFLVHRLTTSDVRCHQIAQAALDSGGDILAITTEPKPPNQGFLMGDGLVLYRLWLLFPSDNLDAFETACEQALG